MIIDAHAHVFPDVLARVFAKYNEGAVGALRRRARQWMKPLSSRIHDAQTMMRHLPAPARKALDELGALGPLLGLIVESTASDLLESLDDAGIDRAVIIAHPPIMENEMVLTVARKSGGRLIPVVNLGRDPIRIAGTLKKYKARGAKAVKIHAASDGVGADHGPYHDILSACQELALPVILHTGDLGSHLLYRDPDQGRAERFESWFSQYPQVRFLLAHMNFHSPDRAMDLAETHGNVWLDTSWQPAETIGQAVRRVGADKILFATDWPFVGDNHTVGLARVRDSVETGLMSEEEAQQVLGSNAQKFFDA